jgi:hypothetical protein
MKKNYLFIFIFLLSINIFPQKSAHGFYVPDTTIALPFTLFFSPNTQVFGPELHGTIDMGMKFSTLSFAKDFADEYSRSFANIANNNLSIYSGYTILDTRTNIKYNYTNPYLNNSVYSFINNWNVSGFDGEAGLTFDMEGDVQLLTTNFLFRIHSDSTITIDAPKGVFIQGTKYSPPSYKEYVFLVSQTGTNKPIATTLSNNDNDTITFTRSQTGNYFINSNHKFTSGKTFINYSPSLIDVGDGSGPGSEVSIVYTNDSRLSIFSTDSFFTYADNVLSNISITIRIYP